MAVSFKFADIIALERSHLRGSNTKPDTLTQPMFSQCEHYGQLPRSPVASVNCAIVKDDIIDTPLNIVEIGPISG